MARMTVRCTTCGRESHLDHASGLRWGWPKCCGYTMRLESTREFIDAIEQNGLPAGAAATLLRDKACAALSPNAKEANENG